MPASWTDADLSGKKFAFQIVSNDIGGQLVSIYSTREMFFFFLISLPKRMLWYLLEHHENTPI